MGASNAEEHTAGGTPAARRGPRRDRRVRVVVGVVLVAFVVLFVALFLSRADTYMSAPAPTMISPRMPGMPGMPGMEPVVTRTP